MMSVEMEIDDFAEFMFCRNINNAILDLSLGGVENNKDLFCFFVDLLCKGLVLLFGKENRVEIENLTMEDFKIVQEKMGCAGIDVHLQVKENIGDIPGINMYEVTNMSDDAPLETFSLKLTSINLIYNIYFNLSHKI